MELSALVGNSRLKDQLSQQERGRGLAHAYIISGPVGSGRHTLARLLSQAMVCQSKTGERPCGQCAPCKKVLRGIHPDVITIVSPGEGKSIAVDQIRGLRSDAYVRPNEGARKVYILERADEMNASAQNAMLKLLEDGPAYAAFLLIVNNSGAVLQTIRSRCEELALGPVSPEECRNWLREHFPQKDRAELERAVAECQGILGRAAELLDELGEGLERRQKAERLAQILETGDELQLFQASMELDAGKREEVIALFDALERALGARIVGGGDRMRLFRAMELVKKLRAAAQLNANPGQLAGWLCAGMFADL